MRLGDEPPAGDLLRDTRRRHGLTQAALARRGRTTQRHISRIESGAVSPSVETLAKLLRAMGEQLTLKAEAGPRSNQSTAELRAGYEQSTASERFADVAALSEFLTGINPPEQRP